jgi:hypothetical protein
VRRSGRARRLARWAGLITTVGATALWGVASLSPHTYATQSGSIHLLLGRVLLDSNPPLGELGWQAFPDYAVDASSFSTRELLGLSWPRSTRSFGKPVVTVPCWCLLALVALPTLFTWWKPGRFGHGRCASCGYDLTGNRSGTCPECGSSAVLPPSQNSPDE